MLQPGWREATRSLSDGCGEDLAAFIDAARHPVVYDKASKAAEPTIVVRVESLDNEDGGRSCPLAVHRGEGRGDSHTFHIADCSCSTTADVLPSIAMNAYIGHSVDGVETPVVAPGGAS